MGEAFYRKGFVESPEFHYDSVFDLGTHARNALAAPRGSAKSTTIGTEMPLFLSITRPYFSTSLGLATDKLVESRFDILMEQLTKNPLIIDDFGPQKPTRGQAIWNHHHLHLTSGSIIDGISVMGKKRGARPHLFILDDPENDPDSDSETSAQLLLEKFERILFRQIIPMLEHGSAIFWIGTLINRRSFLYRATCMDDPRFQYWNRRVLSAIEYDHTNRNHVKVLWDEKWPQAVLEARRDEIGASAFCFTGDTEVYTPTNKVSIANIGIGAEVLDKDRQIVRVKAVSKREVDEVYHIRLYGYDAPLKCSDNHHFWVYRPTWYRNRFFNHSNFHRAITGSGKPAVLQLTEPQWVQAKDLTKNDFCLFPVDNGVTESQAATEFWWFVGRYLAEGHCQWEPNKGHYTVCICAGPKEKHFLERTRDWLETTPWRGAKGPRKIRWGSRVWKLVIGSKHLAEKIKGFGQKSWQKHLTYEAKHLNYANFMSLLGGYLSGDGYVCMGRRCANSVSRQLLFDIKESLAKFGVLSCLTRLKGEHTENILGREYKCRPLYCLRIYEGATRGIRASKVGYFRDGLQYTKIRSVTKTRSQVAVYDIETEGNFLVEGAIVHNSAEYLNDPISDTERVLSLQPRRNEYIVEPAPGAEASYLTNPLKTTACMVWHKRIKDSEAYEEQKEPFGEFANRLFRIITVDYATGLSQFNDYSCIAVMGFDTLNILWILDMWMGRVKESILTQMIYQMARKWMVKAIGVEAVSMQVWFADAVKLYIENQPDNWNPRIIPIKYPAGLAKQDRIMGLEPRFAQGNIKYPAHLADTWPFNLLYSQTRDFTYDLALLPFDDAIDSVAMSQYLVHARGIRPVETGNLEDDRLHRLMKGLPLVKGMTTTVSGFELNSLTYDEIQAIIDRRYKGQYKKGARTVIKRPNIVR